MPTLTSPPYLLKFLNPKLFDLKLFIPNRGI